MLTSTDHILPATSLTDRYRVLLDIGRTLTATLGVEDLYRTIHAEVSGVVDLDGFYISLHDEDRQETRVVFYADGDETEVVDLRLSGEDVGPMAEAGALIQDGLHRLEPVATLGEDHARVMRSAVTVPLRWRGRVAGTISAQSLTPGAFTSDDLDLLQGIADLATVSIQNAHRMRSLEQQHVEARRIEEIGRSLATLLEPQAVLRKVVESALELVSADSASVWLLEDTQATVSVAAGEIALPEGLEWDLKGVPYQTLVERREVIRIDDLASQPLILLSLRGRLKAGSGIAIPIVVGEGVGAILSAGHRQTGAFGPDTERVLRSLAAQAGVALENARVHTSLQTLSLTDPLTGLPNRRHLEIRLRSEVAAARRGRRVALVIFDLDDFKGYNDSWGHLAGDGVLRGFGEVLEDENRAMNPVARFGGDEFIAVLPESGLKGAQAYAERVREAIRHHPVLGPRGVSVSAGVAVFDAQSMRSADDLIRAADRDLYSQKSTRSRAAR